VNFSTDYREAELLDRRDPLAGFRDRFCLPTDPTGRPRLYLCGHSLGLQPTTAARLVEEELEDWRLLGVDGHFEARRPWMPYHELLTPGLARLAGAEPIEVVAMNSLTVNLHLLLASFYRPTSDRPALLIERPAFPSDRYAAESQVRFHGFDPAEALLEIGPRDGESVIRQEDLLELIEREGQRIATLLLPGVQYLSGQCFDMAVLARVARAQGCLVGLDLAHAIGNVPLALHQWDVDFAVWCSYKYLNGGPGAIGGAFVHARHAHDRSLPRFAGWWGHDKTTRFRMGPRFEPLPGAEGWQLSNPPILAMAPLLASLEIFDAAGTSALREKSLALTGYLEFLLTKRLHDAVAIITPQNPAERGCQLSLRILSGRDGARSVYERITARGVVCDWREPDVIRVAPVPLYNTYTDVWQFVDALVAALA